LPLRSRADAMLSRWYLPQETVIGGKEYPIRSDFRDILRILSYLQDGRYPQYFRWRMALAIFYKVQIPKHHLHEAAQYLAWFIRGGTEEEATPAPTLMDWQQDAPLIAADINAVAGQEIRACSYLHWWTFLSWFHAIGDGQFSAVVRIRHKLSRGVKLEQWESDYYRNNRFRVDIKPRYTPAELAQQERLKKLLKGEENGERK